MKRICTILTGLLLSLAGFSQPAISDALIPQYITTDGVKTPFAFRLTLNGLKAGATYRYYNRFTEGWSFGEGFCTIVSSSGNFTRITNPSMVTPGAYGEFTADGSGQYTGWFIAEAEPFGFVVTQGAVVYVRIFLNDGDGGTFEWDMVTADMDPITVLGTDAGNPMGALGTGIRSTAAADGVEKNFVMLYDNTAATGRPVAGTFIESDANANIAGDGYAEFYGSAVDNTTKTWGTLIPNSLPGGIQRIVQYSRSNGTIVGSREAASGTWAKEGGGRVSTIDPSGGITDVIVLNGNIVTLGSPARFNQTISFPQPAARQYGDADADPGAVSSGGLAISYTSSNPAVATIVNGQLHIVGAGATDITAMQAGDEDFNAAQEVVRTITINRAPLTIKADDQQMVSGDPFPAWTATFTGFVNGDEAADLVPGPQFQPEAAQHAPGGEYAINVCCAGSANYAISYLPGKLTMTSNKQPQTISFGAITPKQYGAANFNPGAALSSGNTPHYGSSNPAVATIVNNTIHITGAGSTEISAFHPGDANWEGSDTIRQTLLVNKAALTIRADNKTKLEGHVNPALTITYTGFVYADNASVLTSPAVITTVAGTDSPTGDYAITVSGATAANYTITHQHGVLTVQPLPEQSIDFPNLPAKKYGDEPIPAGAQASSGLDINYSSSNPAVATVVNGNIQLHGAGSTTITAAQPGDADHAAAAPVTRTLTVNKVLLTLRAEDKTKQQGTVNPALTIIYSGFVNNENESIFTTPPRVSTTATAASLVGVYPISISNAGGTPANYNLLLTPGKLTVMPAYGANQNEVAAFCSSPGQLQVNVFADTAQKGVIQLFDPAGNRLLNVPVSIGKGSNSFRLPIGNTVGGIYYLRVIAATFTRKEKVRIP
ncbi:MAG: MBG domain-containing protein [Candidatus Pseudobacter hemicellulosilyticus]|uniref:MBG domain-containing protein n=1 Tax=Candidatus Pseudobacter hemicellulosilyticus TaxID=3121375 RepID=A0AAJ6BHJ3_9BACT|nr:MAG: MBG domain-containing protein [Pseudobacter sp.]